MEVKLQKLPTKDGALYSQAVKPAVIFDLDGTLVDSLPGISFSLNLALREHGLPEYSQEQVRSFIGDGSRILITRAVPSDSSESLITDVENGFKRSYDATWHVGTQPYPGIPEMLVICQKQGIRMAVLSNKPHPFTTAIVAKLFPDIQFAMILGQRPGIAHKPDPSGALEIAAKLNLAVTDCIVVGDSTIDLTTASRAGMASIAVTWGYHDEQHLLACHPQHLVRSVAHLSVILAGEQTVQ